MRPQPSRPALPPPPQHRPPARPVKQTPTEKAEGGFRELLTQPKWLYLLIFGGFLLLHLFIFRDVVMAIPDVLSGKASIVREELVPFFDFGTQFWGEGTSALTSSEEVRVSYSFWTAWVRYDKVLPFAIVLLNTISAFVLFYAFHRMGRYIYKKSLFGVMAAILAALLVYTILLYAKMAHFYVLIIGFSMFALSLSLLCEQIFFKLRISAKNVAAVSLLTLLNPAIHYHVIFYVVAALILLIHAVFTLVMNRKYFWRYLRRGILYFMLVILFSLVPYILYILLTTSSSISGVSTQIPVNYWMIYYASLALPFIFSLDTAGHLDLIRYGNYLTPIPRFGSMLVMFLVGSLFMFRRWKATHIVIKIFIITLFIVMLFAMWMTIGYSENSPYSFHRVLGNIALFFAHLGGGIGSAIAGLFGTFINILRFPHRFQFIYFYAAGILFMIALVWLREAFARRFRPATAAILVVLIALFPLVANNDYRKALTSGDLASFVDPYYIPEDLKRIKSHLASQEATTRMFILPTLESGRELVQDGKRYSFLDKYLIYYLDQPTYYYGVGANTENKLVSYMVYRAISYGEGWWEDILADNLGITDLVVPVSAAPREKGITYLPNIEQKIQQSLASSGRYEKTVSGNEYELYSLKEPRDPIVSLLVDMEWQNMLGRLNTRQMTGVSTFFPLQLPRYVTSEGAKKLMTDSVERSFYDLYSVKASSRAAVPNPISLPFNSEYVASSNFTNNTLSLSTLYAKEDAYNFLHENVPSLVGLQRPSFVGLTKGESSLDLALDVPADGTYRVLLHGASKRDDVRASIDGGDFSLKKIADDQGKTGDYIDFTYFYADVELKQGAGKISLKNTDTNAVLVDSVILMPKEDIPIVSEGVTAANIEIIPTGDEAIYDVNMR